MTDNRTIELHEKLDALGIEHTDASYKRHIPITVWTVDGATFCYVEGFESTDLHIDNATPEQAIAATLGEKPRDMTEEWLLKACNQATQDYVAQLEQEVDELKSKLEAATLVSELNPDGLPMGLTVSDDGNLLNWRGENYVKQGTLINGTLTAEQVREAIKQHSIGIQPELGYGEFGRCFHDKSWQAIADELNAKLGSGTCELKQARWDDGQCTWGCICSACDAHFEHETCIGYNFCPNCGARIRKAVSR